MRSLCLGILRLCHFIQFKFLPVQLILMLVIPETVRMNVALAVTQGSAQGQPSGNGSNHPGTQQASVSHWEGLDLAEVDLRKLVDVNASTTFRVSAEPHRMADAWATYYSFLIYLERKILEYYLGGFIRDLVGAGVLTELVGYAITANSISRNLADMMVEVTVSGAWQSAIDWRAVEAEAYFRELNRVRNPNVPPSVLRNMITQYISAFTGQSVIPTVLQAKATTTVDVDIQRAELQQLGEGLRLRLIADVPVTIEFTFKYLDAIRATSFVMTNILLWMYAIPVYLPPEYFAANREYVKHTNWVNPSQTSQRMPLELQLDYTAAGSSDGTLRLVAIQAISQPERSSFGWRIFPEFLALDLFLRQWADHMSHFVYDFTYDVIYKIFGYYNLDTQVVSSLIRTVTENILNNRRMLINPTQLGQSARRMESPLSASWSIPQIQPYGMKTRTSSLNKLGLVSDAFTYLPALDSASYGQALSAAVSPALDPVQAAEPRGYASFETLPAHLAQLNRNAIALAQARGTLFPPAMNTDYFQERRGDVVLDISNISFESAPEIRFTEPMNLDVPLNASALLGMDMTVTLNNQIVSSGRQRVEMQTGLKPFLKKYLLHHDLFSAPGKYGIAMGLVGRPRLSVLNFNHAFLNASDINEAVQSLLSPFVSRAFNAVAELGEFQLKKFDAEDHISLDSEARKKSLTWGEPGPLQYFRLINDRPITLDARSRVPSPEIVVSKRSLSGVADRLKMGVTLQQRYENLAPVLDFANDPLLEQQAVYRCQFTYYREDQNQQRRRFVGTYSKVIASRVRNVDAVDTLWNDRVQMPEVGHGRGIQSVTNDREVYRLLKSNYFFNNSSIPRVCWIRNEDADIHFVRDNSHSLKQWAGLNSDYTLGWVAKNLNRDEGVCNPVVDYQISGESFTLNPQHSGQHDYSPVSQHLDVYYRVPCSPVTIVPIEFSESTNSGSQREADTEEGGGTPILPPGIF